MVLLSVVLNLADWPYLDEIFGDMPTGIVSELFSAKSADPAKMKGAAAKMEIGYQLLAGLQAIAAESIRLAALIPEQAPTAEPRLFLSSIPRRIDRPPTPGSES